MSESTQHKDRFGNPLPFNKNAEVKVLFFPSTEDPKVILQKVKDTEMNANDVLVVGYMKSGKWWTVMTSCKGFRFEC